MNINNIPALSQYQNALNALGFSGEDSLEQLIGAAQVAAPELAAYLGVPIFQMVNIINTSASSASSIPQSALDIINQATYSLGVELSEIPFSTIAPNISSPVISPLGSVNLISELPPIRNQKERGTCVAHAALSAYEHFLNTNGAFQDLSEQFLYWNCKRNDGIPNQAGTWLRVAFDLLDLEGCCVETTWPYNPNSIAGNEGQNPPPGGAQLQAMSFRNPGRSIPPTSVGDIKNELAAGRCVAFSVPVFNSWLRSPWVANTGDITMPVPNEVLAGGHAMCFVGYFDMTFPGLGGGRFIIRNSWGDTWGINSSFGAGYGTIPYAYIDRMGMEAFVLS
jgi:Papain family cysteine protease